MQTITRHGGGSHYVRPDRVYRTGVLTSTMGYDPNMDAQDVAASFTQYPMDLQTSGLGGFGRALGANNTGLLQRMKLRFDAWLARRRAARGVQGWHYGIGDARMMGVAYPQIGQQIAPAEISKQSMAALLVAGGLPAGSAAAQAGFSWDRWQNMRWNG